MKLSLVFPVFFLFTLLQNIDARPYPEDSYSSWSWFPSFGSNNIPAGPSSQDSSSWLSWVMPTSVSNYYTGIFGVSPEDERLLKKAYCAFDLLEYVPGLEPISLYGKLGIKAVEFFGNTANKAVNWFQWW